MSATRYKSYTPFKRSRIKYGMALFPRHDGSGYAWAGVTVQSGGESVIASAAWQSRWRRGVLWGGGCGYGVEIATAQAPRNDSLVDPEQSQEDGLFDPSRPCGYNGLNMLSQNTTS